MTTEKNTGEKPAAKKTAARASARAAHPANPKGPNDAGAPAEKGTTSPRLVTWDEDGRTRYGLELAVEKHDQGKTARVLPLGDPIGLDVDQVKAHQP